MQNFAEKVARFARAVEQRDGPAFAALFTPEALYHDAIYGAVVSREAIEKMMVLDWYRDGEHWLWDMQEPVCDAERGYARYVASFTSLNRFSHGHRVVVRGVAMFAFEGELFSSYHEVANGTPALWDLQVRGEHLERVVQGIADEQRGSTALAAHYTGPER
ncbi:hypothetical protein A9Q90_03200 [Gammaproteobacteria bacterium 54_18_T64]|nr:hypothetical protein A9Q90_03200 [Gammaproteobacteria bacterium 54_18_T64]